jgi:hypothetical protein
MWQVDNDRYALWRLEHELGMKPINQLLDSVTATDREASLLARADLKPVAAGLGRFFKLLCSRTAIGPIVPRASE